MKFEILEAVLSSAYYFRDRYLSTYELSPDLQEVFRLQDMVVDGEIKIKNQFNLYYYF